MSVCRRLLAAVAAASAAVALTTGVSVGAAGAAAHPGVSVRGDQVRLGNHRFVSRGVIFEGFQFPLEAMQRCAAQQTGKTQAFCQRHVDAQNYYFGKALDLARTDWHANTVRLNLGQVMLDPKSALFNKKNPDGSTWGASYLARVKQAVAFARSKNMVVELALFNYRLSAADKVTVDGKSINHYDPKSGLPTERTDRAMARLAGAVKGDNDVLLEPYNEPYGNANTYVTGHAGINVLIRTARAKGVKTPLVVQGTSADLSALPIGKIKDKNVIFSSHAFLKAPSSDGPGDWARLFGNTAKTRPVLITAWDAVAKTGNWCKKHSPYLAQEFLNYVQARQIGLSGFAFDVNGTMVQNFQKHADAPTTFLPKGAANRCASGAAGQDIKNLFAKYAKG